ncbi:MAG TPA: alpha-glucan family phosphorylase [Candidatus Acidoferrum sp.]|nr:alpha-glucan family phosphorylase [Candidatus Acidoferrum sp.]
MTPANEISIAYFSMEIAADPRFPTYSGGLGVLAADMLRSAADAGLAMVGVTLLHRKGYFRQRLDEKGRQSEESQEWNPEKVLEALGPVISVFLEGKEVKVRGWRHLITGLTGHTVPVFFLDAELAENSAWEQTLTDHLYGGDDTYRLCQEAILGIGGVRFLRAIGHRNISRFHMNEGHSALLTLALLEEEIGRQNLTKVSLADIEKVREKCVFTTHTPVPAASDQFPLDLATRILGADRVRTFLETECCTCGALNMTYLALRCSRYINGVAMRHGELSQSMFPNYPVHSITNGVHAATWTSSHFQELYDRHLPEWRHDNLYLRYAVGIGVKEILRAHLQAKRELLREIKQATGVELSENVATLGFARRAAEYKRAYLLFSDLNRLRAVQKNAGPFQVVFGGKAHPRDESGKAEIRKVFEAAAVLRDAIPVVYVSDYDVRWAKLLTAGVDVWLNTPHRPLEASGTSGMKAALNGVPSLSIRDGWWVEGHFEGVTGWSIGYDEDPELRDVEIASLYEKLEHTILPLLYSQPQGYGEIMRSTIAVNGSFFNTQRMLSQYLRDAYYSKSTDTGSALTDII